MQLSGAVAGGRVKRMLPTLFFTTAILASATALYLVFQRRLHWIEITHALQGPRLRPLADYLPLDDIRGGYYDLSDGSLVAGWELVGIDTEMRDEDAIANEVARIGYMLNGLNPAAEAILQVRRTPDVRDLVDRFDAASKPDSPERLLLWKRWRRQFLTMAESEDAPFLDTRVYLFLRVKPQRRPLGPVALFFDQLRRVATREETGDPAQIAAALEQDFQTRVQYFVQQTRQAIGILDGSVFGPRRLTNRELDLYAKSLLWSHRTMATSYTPSRRDEATAFVTRDTDGATAQFLVRTPAGRDYFPTTIRAQIAAVAYEAFPDHITIDGRLIGVMRLFTAPAQVSETLMVGFRTAIGFPCTYTVRIVPRVKQAELDRMRRQQELKFVTAQTRAPGSPLPDQANISNAQEAQARYEDALNPQRQLFGVEITVTYEATTAEELKQRADALQQFFLGLHDARLIPEQYGADRVFRETLPFAIPSAANARMILFTDEVTCLVPVFTPWHGSTVPVRIFRTLSGEPFAWNPMDGMLTNRNQSHFGKTGSGKGFVGMLFSYLPLLVQGITDVCIIDSGGTYRRMCNVMGGTFFEFSGRTEAAINALAIPPSYYALEQGEQREYLRSQISMVTSVALILADAEATEAKEWTAILSIVVSRIMEAAATQHQERTLREVVAALQAYHDPRVPEHADAARRIAHRLLRYVTDPMTGELGPYAHLFDRPQSFDPDTDLLCVDFNPIKNENANILTAALLLIVGGLFVRRVMHNWHSPKGRWTRWLGDEVVSYLSNPRFRDEIMRGAREFRKARASIDLMAQSWNDLGLPENVSFGTPIKEATGTRIFLQHEETSQARQAFAGDGLELLADRVFSLERRDGFFSQIVIQQATATLSWKNRAPGDQRFHRELGDGGKTSTNLAAGLFPRRFERGRAAHFPLPGSGTNPSSFTCSWPSCMTQSR